MTTGELDAMAPGAADKCEGGAEAHYEHLGTNGECPWCGAYLDTLAKHLHLPLWRTTAAAGGEASR